MKIIGINGSPRKEWNTATLIKKALEGADSVGAETELIDLYDLEYKGCKSCFACKTKGSKSYGRCNVNDDLTPVFERIEEVDAVILGSPIYFGVVTGEMRSFMERMIFPYFTYTNPPKTLFPNKINSAFIYTMNIPEEMIDDYGYKNMFESNKQLLTLLFGSSEAFMSYDTYQFKDYSKVVCERFDPEHKAKHRDKQFPIDKEEAFKLGVRMIENQK
ncbi:MAG: flavodoxin family protein [Methanobacterium sp.]|nr:flavodoxin family protein [Methanobacterium sp.]